MKGLVETIFEEMREKGGLGRVPKPDAVMDEVNKRFVSLLGPRKKGDGSGHQIELTRQPKHGAHRKAYHRAVDLFYDAALTPAKRGAPSYAPEFAEKLRDLHSQGKSYGDLAKLLGLPTTPSDDFRKSKDRVRKLIKRRESQTISVKSSPRKSK